jgi:hypothetical protein
MLMTLKTLEQIYSRFCEDYSLDKDFARVMRRPCPQGGSSQDRHLGTGGLVGSIHYDNWTYTHVRIDATEAQVRTDLESNLPDDIERL